MKLIEKIDFIVIGVFLIEIFFREKHKRHIYTCLLKCTRLVDWLDNSYTKVEEKNVFFYELHTASLSVIKMSSCFSLCFDLTQFTIVIKGGL